MLGSLRVIQGDRVITRFQTQKTGALLAYLALHAGRSFPREFVAELLWPDGDPTAIRNRLNQAISSLRRQLHPPGSEPGYVLMADHSSLSVNVRTVETDVAEFALCVRKANESEDPVPLLRQAVELYQGDLLDGYYEEWLMMDRVRYADMFFDSLSKLTRAYAHAGRFAEAIEIANRRLASDPSEERAHRALMRLYIAAGRPRSAMAQFAEMERALAQEDEVPTERALRLRDEALAALQTDEPDSESYDGPAKSEDVVAASNRPRTAWLPKYLTRFVGREDELKAIEGLLASDTRLITLTGIGGTGKTRLAVQAAWDLAEAYGHRVFFVNLQDVAEAVRVPYEISRTLAHAMGVPDDSAERLLDDVTAEGKALLVLDNLEQLVDQGLLDLSALLTRYPNLAVLSTSRQALGLDGEVVLQVRALPVPEEHHSLEQLAENPSIALFVNRAQSARQDFQLTDRTAEAILQLCQKLEGLPLAIELAATWARSLTPSQMLEQVSEHYDRLASRRKDIHARHRSMRAAIDGSFAMLPDEAKNTFVRLSLFAGGWDHAAAAAVCPGVDVYAAMQALEERSLILGIGDDRARFNMMESVRSFASDHLTPDQTAEARGLHADYFLGLVLRTVRLSPGRAVRLIRSDYSNVTAALRFLIEAGRDTEAVRMAAELVPFWDAAGRLSEARGWLDSLSVENLDDSTAGLYFTRTARIAWLQGDYERSRELNDAALECFRRADDVERILETHVQIAMEAHRMSDFERSVTTLEENIPLAQAVGDLTMEARSLLALGNSLVELGRYDEAEARYDESLRIARQLEEPIAIAMPLANLGNLAVLREQFESGRTWLEESYALFQEAHFRTYAADSMAMLARVDRLTGQPSEALERCRAILASGVEDVTLLNATLLESAYALVDLNLPKPAARLFGFVNAMWEHTGVRVFGVQEQYYEQVSQRLSGMLPLCDLIEQREIGKRFGITEAMQVVREARPES